MPTVEYKSICVAAAAVEMRPVGTVTGATSETITCADLASFKNTLKTYLFRRCYETVWLWITFPFLVIISPPESVVLAMVFYCLGHYKNVYDDDDGDDGNDDDDDDGGGDDGGGDDDDTCKKTSRESGRPTMLCR